MSHASARRLEKEEIQQFIVGKEMEHRPEKIERDLSFLPPDLLHTDKHKVNFRGRQEIP